MRWYRVQYRKFLKATRASALVETALVLPVMVAFILGAIETGHYLLLHMKLDKAISIMGNAITSGGQGCFTGGFMAELEDTVSDAVAPFEFDGNIGFTSIGSPISQVSAPGCRGRGGNCAGNNQGCIYSCIGTTSVAFMGGRNFVFSGDRRVFTAGSGQNYVISELRHRYEPLLSNGMLDFLTEFGINHPFTPRQLIRTLVHKPRYANFAQFGGCLEG